MTLLSFFKFNPSIIRRVLSLGWNSPQRFSLIAFFVYMVGSKILWLGVPLAYKWIINILGPYHSPLSVMPYIAIAVYISLRLLGTFTQDLREMMFLRVEQWLAHLIAMKTFRHLLDLSLDFHVERKTGQITRLIDRGIKSIENLARYFFYNFLPTILEVVLLTSIVAALYPPVFAWGIFLTLVLYIVFTIVVSEWRAKLMRSLNKKDGNLQSYAVDTLLNYNVVKSFGNEDKECARFENSFHDYAHVYRQMRLSLAFLNGGQGVILNISLGGLMILALKSIHSGTMNLGDFIALTTYLLQAYTPLTFLGFAYREIKIALVNLEETFNFWNIRPTIQDKHPKVSLGISEGTIIFDDVTFGYHPGRPILKNFSLTLEGGKITALVGPSGEGKSTLVHLLLRFMDPWSGRILIDGQDLRDITQTSLRKAIALIPQDTPLFNDTLFYNVAYGNFDATEEEVRRAIYQAHLENLVNALPEKEQTMLGERGVKLSGGEKQRVAIARVLLKQPPIVLCDEATSSLDTHTEKEVHQHLLQLAQGRTVLLIAHRLSTVVDAHHIAVIKQGKIAEQGNHAALIQHQGIYAHLWAQQQNNQDTESELL